MSVPVHIVAMGARTPLGLRAETSAAAVRAGVSRVSEHPLLVNVLGEPLLSAPDPQLPPTLPGPDRLVSMLAAAVMEVAHKLADSPLVVDEVPCWLALPEPRPGFVEPVLNDTGPLASAQMLSSGGLPLNVVWHPIPRGHAGAVLGLEQALQALTTRCHGVCLVGGVDSYHEAATLDWLEGERRLLRDEIRGAFPPGEGAALVALTTDSTRRHLRLPSLGVIGGCSHGMEQGDENADEGLLGVALADVYQELGALLPAGGRFDDVFIDINDERARTMDYAFAMMRCGRLFRDGNRYTTSVDITGELGAASAPFNWILAARSFLRGYAAGNHAMVSSASWAGLRGAVLVQEGHR